MSFLFVITFAGCDNKKNAKADIKQNTETVDIDKDTCKGHKCCKRKCDKTEEECKEPKSCKHKCDKDNEDCRKSEYCKGKRKCDKSNNAVKEHKCGEGKCGEGKCGGDNLKEEIKKETDN